MLKNIGKNTGEVFLIWWTPAEGMLDLGQEARNSTGYSMLN